MLFSELETFSNPMDEAEFRVRIWLYPAYRRTDKHKVEIVLRESNNHFRNIVSKVWLKKLERGLLVEYR